MVEKWLRVPDEGGGRMRGGGGLGGAGKAGEETNHVKNDHKYSEEV